MPADDREQNFERALARHLRSASSDASCPDAEVLAAYHERALSLDEMAQWKAHIAGCARCQETLALVEQTDHLSAQEWEREHVAQPLEQTRGAVRPLIADSSAPASKPAAAPASLSETIPARISKELPHLSWRWVAPLGLAAAAVIVWIGVGEIRTQRLQQLQKSVTQIAENRRAAPPAPLSSSAPPPIAHLQRVEPEAKLISPEKAPVAGVPSGVSPKAAALAAGASSTSKNRVLDKKSSNQPVSSAPIAEAEAPPSPPVSGYLEKSEAADQVAPASAPTTRARADSEAEKKQDENASPGLAAETVEVQAQAPTVNERASQVSAHKAAINANLLSVAAGDRRYVVAPGEKHVWRVGNAGSIEYSSDRGKTWKAQTSGVATDLTAGAAVSDKICWVVGKAGTVVLTTDGGKHWRPLAPPLSDDLGGVQASDAAHASIWDVFHRKKYETADSGVTWTRPSNE